MPSAVWYRGRASRRLVQLLVAATLAASACSVLVDRSRQQCYTDDDCHAHGEAFAGSVCIKQVCEPDPTWACLGGVDWPTPTDVRKATVTIKVRDLITEEPMVGVTGRLCRKLDLTCSDPVTSDLAADQNGNLVVIVDVGFDGYVEMRAKDKMPGLYFFYPPVDGDREVSFVPLLNPAVLGQFAQLNGKQLVADRGHVLIGAYDCQKHPAEGLRFATTDGDGETTPFYVLEKLPKVTATETDRSGRGGFINLRPGTVTVSADLVDGRHVGSASVLVRSGTITYTSLVPSPR
jgi:hypothetical protein